jgi:hypothetical protein
MENMKLTLISVNGRWAFVWMPDKDCPGRYGYGADGRCRAPRGILSTLFGIRRGDCMALR